MAEIRTFDDTHSTTRRARLQVTVSALHPVPGSRRTVRLDVPGRDCRAGRLEQWLVKWFRRG